MSTSEICIFNVGFKADKQSSYAFLWVCENAGLNGNEIVDKLVNDLNLESTSLVKTFGFSHIHLHILNHS